MMLCDPAVTPPRPRRERAAGSSPKTAELPVTPPRGYGGDDPRQHAEVGDPAAPRRTPPRRGGACSADDPAAPWGFVPRRGGGVARLHGGDGRTEDMKSAARRAPRVDAHAEACEGWGGQRADRLPRPLTDRTVDACPRTREPRELLGLLEAVEPLDREEVLT